MRQLARAAHLLFVIVLAAAVVAPAIPSTYTGAFGRALSRASLKVSIKQSWRMYAPNPMRALAYMNLTAQYPDGTERPLAETEQERYGWGTHWAWNKTRVDIWRMYASFKPKRSNRDRTWYLKSVCVREARRGPIPKKIVMHQVRRRFTPPAHVRRGADPLGPPQRTLVTVQYCKTKDVKEMIEADRQRRGVDG